VWSALLLASVFLTNCKDKVQSQETSKENAEVVDTLPVDFVSFFDRFHADSLYQMEHIIFPLEGLPNAQNSSDTVVTERYFWQREDWIKHNRFTDPSGAFEHWYEVIDPRVIEHWVRMKGTTMVIRRRFAKMGEEWFLIYYAGLRPLTKQ